jgi:hypothetical protein
MPDISSGQAESVVKRRRRDQSIRSGDRLAAPLRASGEFAPHPGNFNVAWENLVSIVSFNLSQPGDESVAPSTAGEEFNSLCDLTDRHNANEGIKPVN